MAGIINAGAIFGLEPADALITIYLDQLPAFFAFDEIPDLFLLRF